MNLSSVQDGKGSSSCVVFILYFLEQQTVRKLPPLGLTHHAEEYQLALLNAAHHPGSYQAILRSSRTGSTLYGIPCGMEPPILCRDGEMPLSFCDDGTQT